MNEESASRYRNRSVQEKLNLKNELVRVSARLVSYAARRMGDFSIHVSPEDVVQSAVAELLSKIEEDTLPELRGSLDGYARTAVLNRIRKLHRNAGIVKADTEHIADMAAAPTRDRAWVGDGDTVDPELKSGMREIFAGLTSAEREILFLALYFEADRERASAVTGLTKSGFNSALFRARNEFQKRAKSLMVSAQSVGENR